MSESQKPEEQKPEEEVEVGVTPSQHVAPPKSDSRDDGLANSALGVLDKIVEMGEDEFIPWEEITLPSAGEYYEGKIPNGVVRVRAMGIHAEKILSTQRLAQTGQSIDYLFQHCVQVPEGFDVSDLLSGDRVFLLYVIRGITHGNEYEFIMSCPNCDGKSTHMYDLNELASTITGPDHALGPEPFKVSLPYMSQRAGDSIYVRVRMLRGRDMTDVATRSRFKKRVHSVSARNVGTKKSFKSIAIDETLTDNLSMVITAFGVEGKPPEVTDTVKIKQLIGKLHATDSSAIRSFLQDNSPGIDTTIEVECPNCANDFRTELPITESFFRPASKGRS